MSMAPRNKRKDRSSPEQQIQSQSETPSSSSLAVDNLSSPLKKPCRFVLPPGYKFLPDEKELFFCYLKPYLDGNKNSWPNVPIHHVNIYKSNPEQLSVEFEKGNETEWFFISERNKVAKGGIKQKRGDKGGYWHATVAAKEIISGKGFVGKKSALSYYVGKQPDGVKTKWLMHEYWFESSSYDENDYALYKIYVSPHVLKKEKAEKEENEKLKKEEEKEEVEQMDLDQPEQSQLDLHQPDQSQLDLDQPEQSQLYWHQHDQSQLDLDQPDQSQLDWHQPDQSQLDWHQPDQPQLQDIVYQQQQQYCLLLAQDHQEPQQLPHSEVVSFEQEPVSPENFDFLAALRDEDVEFNNIYLFE